MSDLLPWQHGQWQGMMERLRTSSLPHALLLCGPGGLGKNRFATRLVQTLLCETGPRMGGACGQCRSCLLYAAGNHPDQRALSPVEPGKAIGIDQVREVTRYLSQTAQYGGYKAVIIDPADQLNANAANSLLKTLEEPPAWSLILLISDRPGRLPATILSRCQRVEFKPPKPREAQQWLAAQISPELDAALLLDLAEGAPLGALQLIEDDVFAVRLEVINGLEALARGKGNCSTIAEQFLKIGARQTLYWMYNWTADMIRFLSGGERYMVNRDIGEHLIQIARRAGLQGANNYISYLNEVLRLSDRQLNPQLSMENILMTWQDVFLDPRSSEAGM